MNYLVGLTPFIVTILVVMYAYIKVKYFDKKNGTTKIS